jgi:hypothetical protein
MNKILGYGEDALTMWALKNCISKILHKLNDDSNPSNCLIFFRPSFGRSGGKERAEFGEFDAILSSLENVYLIESKWDRFLQNKKDEIKLSNGQTLRHKIFSWYFKNWNPQQYSDWKGFSNALQGDFRSNFPARKIAPEKSRLSRNLELVLRKLHYHCEKDKAPRNVLFYFLDRNRSKEISKVISGDLNFAVVNIDYSETISDNFVHLD